MGLGQSHDGACHTPSWRGVGRKEGREEFLLEKENEMSRLLESLHDGLVCILHKHSHIVRHLAGVLSGLIDGTDRLHVLRDDSVLETALESGLSEIGCLMDDSRTLIGGDEGSR
ncbi:hypothetical protein PFISCL1PPCAC_6913 [Pristionchus fissidentatus]|uniref:Uncharacterized protein n=1 Tax=Pristionchus fissidentatus TaxID=1538716 RepID=A0AAV5V7J1_9BILA|nr:hypothetical protein PFISCL1PPCAC_6913 [Pristionchus fissidentatus]